MPREHVVRHIERLAGQVRECLSVVPSSVYHVAVDRLGHEMAQTDDYHIDWEFEVVPSNPNSCSLAVILSIGPGAGRLPWARALQYEPWLRRSDGPPPGQDIQ